MAKRNDFKKRLKAADKRRKRRSAPGNAVVVAGPVEPRIRPANLIANVLVDYADRGESPTDIVAATALRACLRGHLPAKDPARGLALEIEAVGKQPGVTPRSYRDAITELLDAAQLHVGEDSPDSFLGYLSLLSESL